MTTTETLAPATDYVTAAPTLHAPVELIVTDPYALVEVVGRWVVVA